MDKEEKIKQILAESKALAEASVRADPKISNKIRLEVHELQKRILAKWVMEARHGHIDALMRLRLSQGKILLGDKGAKK